MDPHGANNLDEIAASIPPASPDASIPPASPSASIPPANSVNSPANPAVTTISPPSNFSWNDADIAFAKVKPSLVIETNRIMLAILVALVVAAIVTGNQDRPWNLVYMWIGALIGWLLRDRKDPKRDDNA